jgi:CheY-like chemotaxis protein
MPRPELILLDMMMPDMDGRSFLIELRQRLPLAAIPVVVFSARDLEEQFAQVVGFLNKPIDLDHLLDTVAQLCQRPSK